MVPFDMLGMVSYECAIVTLSVRQNFDIFTFEEYYNLGIRVGVTDTI